MDSITQNLQNALASSPLLALILAFVGGLLTSFTPCIYPLIPITAGVVGGSAKGSKIKAFSLAFTYVLGISITYSALGLAAALSGKMLFASVAINPWINLIIGNILLIFGLSMFEVFMIKTPAAMNNLMAKISGKGFTGIFLLGLVSGLIASPCTAPVTWVLLTYVATTGQAVFGILLLFVYSIGMCLLLLLVGTFSGVVKVLPKSGIWMIKIKKILGLIMIIASEYFFVQAGKFFL